MSSIALAPHLVRARPLAREATLLVVGVAVMSLLAQVAIPLPFTPVPLTGQTFGALLIGGAYGAMRAGATLAGYLLMGAMGAPVLAGGMSGMPVFTSPSAGYLFGMLAAGILVGVIAERGWDRRLGTSLVAMLVGSGVIYLFGATWLSLSMNVDVGTAVHLGVTPFLLGDALKLALAGALLPASWTMVKRTGSP